MARLEIKIILGEHSSTQSGDLKFINKNTTVIQEGQSKSLMRRQVGGQKQQRMATES